jgi:hypothetical protein
VGYGSSRQPAGLFPEEAACPAEPAAPRPGWPHRDYTALRYAAPETAQDSAGSTVIPAARAASKRGHADVRRRSAAGSMVTAVANTKNGQQDVDPLVVSSPGQRRPETQAEDRGGEHSEQLGVTGEQAPDPGERHHDVPHLGTGQQNFEVNAAADAKMQAEPKHRAGLDDLRRGPVCLLIPGYRREWHAGASAGGLLTRRRNLSRAVAADGHIWNMRGLILAAGEMSDRVQPGGMRKL